MRRAMQGRHAPFRPRTWPAACALLLAAWVLTSPLVADEAPPTAPHATAPASVLFVGNSFTFYNNAIYTHLRGLLVAHDPSLRDSVFLKSLTVSGAVLADHASGLEYLLGQREWDVVVLQGHSREAFEPGRRTAFEETAAQLVSMIKAAGARPVLFMTWAYADKPGMTAKLDTAFSRLGKALDVEVIPVGLAFAQALETIPGLSLHTSDTIHPTLEGTYLAACVFYATLWKQTPEALDYTAGLPADTARALRQTAWRVAMDYDGTQ